jgi:hypothetical protein
MAQDLTVLFNKFAGKEIPMTEKMQSYGPGIRGVFKVVELADHNNPIIKAMGQLAQANGLSLRLLWPGVVGTMDFNPNRITANIEKEADGKYRVSGDFKIG